MSRIESLRRDQLNARVAAASRAASGALEHLRARDRETSANDGSPMRVDPLFVDLRIALDNAEPRRKIFIDHLAEINASLTAPQ